MMVVVEIEVLDMQRDAGVHGKSLEELAEQLGIDLADLVLAELGLEHQERPAGDVERRTGERAVHRKIRAGIAADALLVAQRLGHGLAQRDADILHRMVEIDVQVALAGHVHVDQRMAAELVQHVVEKADAGRHAVRPGAVEVDRDGDLGLIGLAGDAGGAHGGLRAGAA